VIGAPPPPRVVAVVLPSPAPEYVWVTGYWYPVGRHYKWHEGYWTRPPYEGARWIPPRHDGERYYTGHWEGDGGRVEHDHAGIAIDTATSAITIDMTRDTVIMIITRMTDNAPVAGTAG